MLVAPLVVHAEQRQSRLRVRRMPARRMSPRYLVGQDPATHASTPPFFLVVWAALGAIAWICMPAARGGAALGATGPFWLIGAPLLDLMWLKRALLWGAVTDVARELRNGGNQPRWPSRLRSIRRRNSSMIRR